MLRRSWAFILVAALAVSACEGPEGPAGPTGPAGPAGAAGPAGPAGPAGQDANENCTQCHTSDVEMFAKQQQLLNAAHGPGQYVRDSGECAVCHTHQGFLDRLETGEWSYTYGSVDDVVPMNCRTCHVIHTTYTRADYALTADGIPVEFRLGGATVDFDNTSNLCASCHQARIRSGQMPDGSGDDVSFTSTHWGPHGSPQGNINAGSGFFFGGDREGMMMAHQTDSRSEGCKTCHMAEGTMNSGGHTFAMGSGRDANYTGCLECHADVDSFDKFGQQTATQALLDELGVLLEAVGIMHYDADDGEWHPVPGTYTADEAAAAWDFQGVMNDGSLGVHNPPYVKNLLEGAIAALGG